MAGAQWGFLAIAAAMLVAVVAVLRRAAPGRRTVAGGLVWSALALLLYAQLGEWSAMRPQRAELSLRWQREAADPPPALEQALRAELQSHLDQRPDDARARVLQARLALRDGHADEAAALFARALAEPGRVASDAAVWVEYAEARGLAQGGTLLGEPRRLIERALALDALHPQALDLAGSAAWEAGDFAAAARHWQRLLPLLDEADPRRASLERAIERAERRAALAPPSER